jgi:hypothetical protein
MLDTGYSNSPPARICPQMTQITQIYGKENIYGNLRDLRAD